MSTRPRLPARLLAIVAVLAALLAATGSPSGASATLSGTSGQQQAGARSATPQVKGEAAVGEKVRCAGRVQGKAKRWSWRRDGRAIKGARGKRYRVVAEDAGHALACRVRVRGARAQVSRAVDVVPFPATSTTPSIEGLAAPGSTVTCDPGTWNEVDRLDVFWKRDGSPAGEGPTYDVGAGDLGRTLVCAVAGWNASGGSGRVDSAGVVVTADGSPTSDPEPVTSSPTSSSRPEIEGDPLPGEVLTCDPGTWVGATTLTYTWTRDGSPAGAGETYAVTPADLGRTLVCLVVGSNAAGSSGAVASDGVVVTDGTDPEPEGPGAPVESPVNTAAPSVTGVPNPGWTLTCDPGTWRGDPVLSYSWTRNGSPAGTASTYDVTPADVGTTLVCLVSGSNAAGASGFLQSDGVEVVMPPAPASTVAPSVTGYTGAPVLGDTLVCSQGSWAHHPYSFAVSWTREGATIAGADDYEYAVVKADIGDEVGCTIRATNAGGSTTADAAPVVPVPVNTTAPSITGLTAGGTGEVDRTLTCDAGGWDRGPFSWPADFYTYSWQRDGVAVDGAGEAATYRTSSTYTPTWDDADADLTCTVVLTQHRASSAPATSASVRVLPPPPVADTAPTVSPERAEAGDLLTCDIGTWSNRATSYSVTWHRGAGAIPGATVLPAGGDTTVTRKVILNDVAKPMRCEVAAINSGGTTSETSNTVSPIPSNTVLPAVAGTPEVGETLTCDPGTWNKAGDYAYAWQRDGAAIAGEAGGTYATDVDDTDAEITCSVVLTHSGVASDPATSAAVLVVVPAGPSRSVSAGTYFSVMLDGSDVLTWGNNAQGQLGHGSGSTPTAAPIDAGGAEFVAVEAGRNHTVAIDTDGDLWTFGRNDQGQLGRETSSVADQRTPTELTIAGDPTFVAASAGGLHTIALASDGDLWTFGYNGYGQLGRVTTRATQWIPTRVDVTGDPTFTQVSAGWEHTLAVDESGHLWSFGSNTYQQLGRVTPGSRSPDRNPGRVEIDGDPVFTSVDAGADHSLAVDDAGRMWSFGSNDNGRLGRPAWTIADRLTPSLAQVSDAGARFRMVGAGREHSVALDTEGRIWVFGSNGVGQLGTTGGSRPIPTPLAVAGDPVFTDLSGGEHHNLAIDEDGVLWGFGRAYVGELGSGVMTGAPAPLVID